MTMIFQATYSLPSVDTREVLRYAGCREEDAALAALLREAVSQAEAVLRCGVCWRKLPVTISGSVCDFGSFSVTSQKLALHLQDCRQVLLLAATVGVGLDRLIARTVRLSPARALLLQAIGTERIEALCDVFCAELSNRYGSLTSRFSPGYGDLPLTCQKEIFSLLECEKRIGLTLTESLLMSPSKSVTAFVGIR